ncbi:MAG: LLM class flavin-dependent oxidoreductase [Alphaproteobacteria bacterium]|nr:LLM class flavin-dependent oxidoreductase [Alphaproteobacteria bacterium]
MTELSILDLVPVRQGLTPREALQESAALAQHAEDLGYKRFWVAEHHNMEGIAGAATAVVLGHIAGHTKSIRVGSGGIMLPNHSPLVIAEQFGTLASLFPGRIDLGLGRAPGTDRATLRALRRDAMAAESFPDDVLELQAFLAPAEPGQAIRAVPGAGTQVPLWILGSSLYGAQLAAILGLPYAFASHFAPDALDQALALYRERFQPSQQLGKSYAVAAANVIVADTDEAARRLFTSVQMRFVGMVRNERGLLQPPIDDINSYWTASEQVHASRMLTCSFVGSPATVETQLRAFVARTGIDELIVASAIYDQHAKFRSFELLRSLSF